MKIVTLLMLGYETHSEKILCWKKLPTSPQELSATLEEKTTKASVKPKVSKILFKLFNAHCQTQWITSKF